MYLKRGLRGKADFKQCLKDGSGSLREGSRGGLKFEGEFHGDTRRGLQCGFRGEMESFVIGVARRKPVATA